MTRRALLRLGLRAMIGAPLLWAAERIAPARYTEAIRARFYPGAIRRADRSRVAKPARWAG